MRPYRDGKRLGSTRFTFISPLGLDSYPMTRAHVRLLGPCFKTGRVKPRNKCAARLGQNRLCPKKTVTPPKGDREGSRPAFWRPPEPDLRRDDGPRNARAKIFDGRTTTGTPCRGAFLLNAIVRYGRAGIGSPRSGILTDRPKTVVLDPSWKRGP